MTIKEALTGDYPDERLILLSEILDQDKTSLLAHPEATLPESAVKKFNDCLKQLSEGVPLAYILGHWFFYKHDFLIAPGVLIPRPETALLVAEALKIIDQEHLKEFAEIGIGSGVISISLLKEREDLTAVATDTNDQAINLTKANVAKLDVAGRLIVYHGNLLKPLTNLPPLIVANLPYLTEEEYEQNTGLHQEPREAFVTKDGLEIFQQLKNQLLDRNWHGWLLLEIDPRRTVDIEELFTDQLLKTIADSNDWERVMIIKI